MLYVAVLFSVSSDVALRWLVVEWLVDRVASMHAVYNDAAFSCSYLLLCECLVCEGANLYIRRAFVVELLFVLDVIALWRLFVFSRVLFGLSCFYCFVFGFACLTLKLPGVLWGMAPFFLDVFPGSSGL